MVQLIRLELFGGPCDGQLVEVPWPLPPILSIEVPRCAGEPERRFRPRTPYRLVQITYRGGQQQFVYTPPQLAENMIAMQKDGTDE